VDHVLDFSKLESGDMEIVPAPTEVSKLIGDVVGSFRTSNKVELRCKVNALPALMVDPQRIGQMLFDLVGNAVKFTTSGFIEVRATFTPGGACPVATDGEVSGTLRIKVEDSGCGIGEEDLKRIMSPYEKVNSKEARNGGTGIGLALCKQLAKAMGGELSVASTLGVGSTFTVTMPGVKISAGVSGADSEAMPAAAPAAPVSGGRRRILIVDDQKMNIVVLRTLLKKIGDFDIVPALNGREALGILEVPDSKPFDMVLTDMWMPELDGEGLVKAIRANERLKSLPVYVITADIELKSTFAEKGFDGIVLKPVTVGAIGLLLSGASGRSQAGPA
jgi:CheY-like chemotaxis protein